MGISASISVDDGEEDFYNSTMQLDHQRPIKIDEEKGVQLGGEPEIINQDDIINQKGIILQFGLTFS